MKKTILILSCFVGLAITANAQQAPGTVNPNEKPKSAIELAKQNAGNTSTADTSKNAASGTQKKTVKRSCCKKHAEGQPCNETPAVKPKSSATKQN